MVSVIFCSMIESEAPPGRTMRDCAAGAEKPAERITKHTKSAARTARSGLRRRMALALSGNEPTLFGGKNWRSGREAKTPANLLKIKG